MDDEVILEELSQRIRREFFSSKTDKDMKSIDYTQKGKFSKKTKVKESGIKTYLARNRREKTPVSKIYNHLIRSVISYERDYGYTCICCGKNLHGDLANLFKKELVELCCQCETALDERYSKKEDISLIEKAILKTSVRLKLNINPKHKMNSYDSYTDRKHNNYVNWVRKNGLMDEVNIVRRK